MSKMVVFAGVVLTALVSGGSVRANLIVNGGFEESSVFELPDGWDHDGAFVSDSSLSFFGGWGPRSGNQYAAFGFVGSLGTISQTLTTEVGKPYLFEFYTASDGNTPNGFQAWWNGTLLSDEVDIPQQNYQRHAFVVEGTGTDVIVLAGRDDPGWQSLDDVSVTRLPEPAPLACLAGAVLTLAGQWRRRSRGAPTA
ncbi:MAG: hypothetical protein ACKV0T_22295 [Planctomycetales bacterium]